MFLNYKHFLHHFAFLVLLLSGLDVIAGSKSIDLVIEDLASINEIRAENIVDLLRLQEALTGQNLTSEIASVNAIKNNKYPNGVELKDYQGVHYPNGQVIKDYMGMHYFNGKVLKDYTGLHYPNGQVVKNYSGIYNIMGEKINVMPMIEWPPQESAKRTKLPEVPSIVPHVNPEKGDSTALKVPSTCMLEPKDRALVAEAKSMLSEAYKKLYDNQLKSRLTALISALVSERSENAFSQCQVPKKLTQDELKHMIKPQFMDICKKEFSIVDDREAANLFEKILGCERCAKHNYCSLNCRQIAKKILALSNTQVVLLGSVIV